MTTKIFAVATPVTLMLLVQALAAVALQAVPVLATDAAGDFGIAKEYVGFFVSANYSLAMLGSLAGGSLVANHGAIRVSQFSLLLCAAGILVFATGSAWALLPAAVLLGMGYGPATPASSDILVRTTPARLRNLVFSIKQSGVPLGGIIVGSVVAPLTYYFGWRGAAVAVAAGCLTMALLLQPYRRRFDGGAPREARPQPVKGLQQLRDVLREPLLRNLCLVSIAFSATQVSLATYLVLLLIDNVGMSLIAAGMVLTLTQAAGGVGRVFCGSLADRLGRPLAVLAALGFIMALGAFAVASLGPGTSQVVVIATGMVFGVAAIGWTGVFLAEVARQAPPDKVGEVTGAAGFFTFSGPLIGPSLFGLILWLTGSYAVGFGCVGIAAGFAGFVLFRAAIGESGRRPRARAAASGED